MLQLLNNIWNLLCSENVFLVNILVLPLYPVESILLMSLFLVILNINATLKQKIAFVVSNTIISIISAVVLTSPFNVLFNYTCMFLLIKFIFKLSLLKSFLSLLISIFTFGMLNILIQNPYLTVLNISADEFMSIPVYRVPYLIFLYFIIFIIYIFFKKFKKIKFNLDLIDILDKKTIFILCINLIIGLSTLCMQLVITSYYIEIVPTIMSIFNFILLISFLGISIYSFSRMIKLASTKMELQNAEEYNKSLEFLYDKVKGFKHDFDNIVASLDGYIETNDIVGLKSYFTEMKKDCQIANNLSLINPRTINNPGIYSLLNSKFQKATNLGVRLDIDFFIKLDEVPINTYKLSRILGILADNAIEEAQKCEEKIVRISLRRENRNHRAVITVENTYSNKNVDISEIFKKGVSSKENHSGIGLWEVSNYVKRSTNLDLYTTKNEQYFKQELFIYDLKI